MTSFTASRFDEIWQEIDKLKFRIAQLEALSGLVPIRLCDYCETKHDPRVACKAYVKHSLAGQSKIEFTHGKS
jgi:hypothetical protein